MSDELLPTYRFEGYALVPAEESDVSLAEEWTKADPFHVSLAPHFWTFQAPGINSFRLEDKNGSIFFFRMQMTSLRGELKVYIQFAPETAVSSDRTREALQQGMLWLEGMLKECGFNRLTFDSKNTSLVLFAKRRLRFNVVLEGDHYKLFKEV